MNKSEFYASIIKIHKESGQGISGLVTMNSDYAQYMEEFVEEKLLVCCETGGSLGTPESNRFYMPSKGYNVFQDDFDLGHNRNYNIMNLTFVRIYLGFEWDKKNSKTECIQDVELMKKYAQWLEKNKEELIIMQNLDDFYVEQDVVFSDDELSYIHNTEAYQNNLTIKELLVKLNKYESNNNQKIPIYKKLLKLYDDKNDIDKCQKELAESEKEIRYIKKFKMFINKHKEKVLIQSII